MPKKINHPAISVIIPTFNRDEFLKKTLASLVRQTFKSFEVLVCDDGGKTGNTETIASKYNKHFSCSYIWRENKNNLYNPAATRNLGVENVNGKYIMFLDCDIVLKPNTIERMHKWLNKFGRSQRYHITAGKRIHLGNHITEKDIMNNFSSLSNCRLRGFGKKYEGVSLSCAGMIRKDIFEKIGGFDAILFEGLRGQDLELMDRLTAFIDNKTFIQNDYIYHLNNRNISDERRIESGNNENLGREIAKEKFIKMGFTYQNKKPIKNLARYTENHYQNFLKNKLLMENISQDLRKKVREMYVIEKKINSLPEAEYSNDFQKSKFPFVYIVLLNYNGIKWLKKSIPSLLKTNYPNYKILVVDNNSSDPSLQYLKDNFPKIEVLKLNKNLGYAGGNNQGMKLAFRKGAEYIAVLNNDIEVRSDWLKLLVNAAENDFECGAAGPLVLNGDGNKIQGPMKSFNKPTYLDLESLDNINTKEVGKLVGCAILFKRKAVEKVGLFDRRYFCYQEEFDWFQRSRYHGFKSILVPQSRIMHYGFGTSAKRKDIIYYKMRFLYSANEIRRFLKDPNTKFIKLLKYVTFKHHKNYSLKNLPLYIISYIYNLIKLPQILKKRKIEKQGGCYL